MASLAPGQAPINSRTAELVSAQQDAQHTAQFNANQALPRSTYIDPSTGKDSRQMDANGNPIEGTGTFINAPAGQSNLAAPVGKVPTSQGLQNVQNVYGAQGNNSTYNNQTGQVAAPAAGAHGQAGATGNPTKTTNPPGYVDPNSVSRNGPAGTQKSDAEVAQEKAAISANNTELLKQQQMQQDNEQKTSQDNANSNAAADQASNTVTTNPIPASLSALATTPETQAILGAFQQSQAQIDQTEAANKAQFGAEDKSINSAYDKSDARLQGMEDDLKSSAEQMKGLIQTMHDQTQADLDTQKAAEQQRQAWNEDQQTRALSKQSVQAHASLVAQIALAGGFGQDAGLREVATSDATFNQKISDLQTEFGVQSTELSAKYSALYVKNNNDYITQSMTNFKDLQDKLQSIGLAQNTNDTGRATAETGLMEKAWATEVSLRQDHAKGLTDATSAMNAQIDKKQAAEQAQANYEKDYALKVQSEKDAAAARADSLTIAQMNHADSMANTASAQQTTQGSALSSKFDTIKGKLETKADPYDVYRNVDAFNKSFGHAYDTFFGLDPTTGNPMKDANGKVVQPTSSQRAVADGQMAFQFSHSQNPGSLRIQDVATEMAQGNQSVYDRITATIQHAADGGGVLTDGIRQTMKTLIDQHLQDAQSAATTSVLSAWSSLQKANAMFPDALTHYTPADLTTDPAMLNAMYQNQDKAGGDFWDNGGATTSQSGVFPPNQLNAPAPKTSGITPADIQSSSIGGKTVSAQPYMLSALQAADQQMYAATGEHIDVNESYRSNAQQAKTYASVTAKGGRVAPPGKSYHEKGLAVDIANYQKAAPYLAQYGVVNGLSDDMGHFSIGEMNPEYISSLNKKSQMASTGNSSNQS